MPTRAKRPCPRKMCKGLWDGKTCTVCSHKPRRWNWGDDKERGTAAERGYDRDWFRLRARKIKTSPICERCGVEPTEQVHHIKPFKGKDDPLRLAWSNLESLCGWCHGRETGRRGGGR
jgi:5-methylcytosine-specific restriction protein A